MANIEFGTYTPLGNYEIEWLDEQDNPIGNKIINGVTYSDVAYGKYVKVKINGDKTSMFFLRDLNICDENSKVVAKVKKSDLEYAGSDTKISKPILLSVLLYNDHLAEFDANSEVKLKTPQKYHIRIDNQDFTDTKDILIPYTYIRNSEEHMGLVPIDYVLTFTTTQPRIIVKPIVVSLTDYKNKSIEYDSIKKATEIEKLVNDFIDQIFEKKDLDGIKELVEIYARKLWDESVKYAKANSDDRPMYWARLKMQVYLKRHPIFIEDIDYTKSLVKVSTTASTSTKTKLADMITLFEEKSRNYTDANFTGSGKKILITGFDPFQLYNNIRQSNPSGVLALVLADELLGGAEIKTMLFPVRYTDFDSSQDRATGEGTGVVEKYIGDYIKNSKADMIITISQYLNNGTFIDKFGTSRRGGGTDNMYFRRINNSIALPITNDDEWIETTLPSQMCVALPSLNNIITQQISYNWRYKTANIENSDEQTPSTPPDKIITTTTSSGVVFRTEKQTLISGSGGSYLSNEIFYRVAKMRKHSNRPTMPTGHLHVQMLQSQTQDLPKQKMDALIQLVTKSVEAGAKTL